MERPIEWPTRLPVKVASFGRFRVGRCHHVQADSLRTSGYGLFRVPRSLVPDATVHAEEA
jgi:hypothetical protein